MEQPLYTAVTVNNEIELCEISNMECKQLIEKALLRESISYYIRWPKPSIFSRKKNVCIICVNDSSRESAENVVRAVCDEKGFAVKFLLKRTQNSFL
ncbi:MAG: hypothetical protein HFH89_00675 [Lachnospiraceae bacterium]|nr:hypothetical protein [uncultured Acetatifactor sp.]MCI8286186.1 hypothetical protein [Lachnospiraceae bacterium]